LPGCSLLLDRGDVADPGIGRLGEDRRRISDIAKVDAANIDGFEQRRTKLEIDPLDVDAERLEDILHRVPRLHRRKETALLRADPNLFRGRLASRMR